MELSKKCEELVLDKLTGVNVRTHESVLWLLERAKCESEIERMLFVSFYLESLHTTLEAPTCVAWEPYTEHDKNIHSVGFWLERINSETVYIFHQVNILNYRVDFMAYGLIEGKGVSAIAIECDGHDFHERTKEQAQRDKSRDRALLAIGVPVMRFTGSEVFRETEDCACIAISYFKDIEHADFKRKFPGGCAEDENIPF